MNRFFDPTQPVLSPYDIVFAFTKESREELALPGRAIITFNNGDLNYLTSRSNGKLVGSWAGFRQIYTLSGSATIALCSSFGGPNICALVEELAAFGVEEFVLWGYCGGIDPSLAIGDILMPRDALREDGASFHYMENDDLSASSGWLDEWIEKTKDEGFRSGTVWTCDAIYRETRGKVARYRQMGVSGVEMETASFYSVCKHLGLKGIAFLVVSDLLTEGSWVPGFKTKPFRAGAKKLSQFILDHVIE